MSPFRTINIPEKLFLSSIKLIISLIISTPFFLLWGLSVEWKISVIVISFLYSVFFLIFNKNRGMAMIITRTYWEKHYSWLNHVIFIILYTLSFSTLFFWIVFPFDLFIANMLVSAVGSTDSQYIAITPSNISFTEKEVNIITVQNIEGKSISKEVV